MQNFLMFIALALAASLTAAQESPDGQEPILELEWSAGPGTFDVTSRATIDLPADYDRLDADDTATLMELMENPASDEEYYVGPVDQRWFAIFSYEDTGHIEDDEEIDAGDLLDSIRKGTEYGNQERRERGWAEMQILGWQYEPAYNDSTNRLSWAVLGESEGQRIVNYNTRLLSRTGVMSATLVASPETLDSSVEEFEELLSGFEYNSGERYAEYQPGDKLAAYGLAALVTGGAAAAVAKGAGKGLFKAIGLAIVMFFALIWTRIKGLFVSKPRD